MRLNALELTDYRNIRTAYFEPGRELTVVCGENGQGKTNLLEAVWMLTGSKSFRGAKDAELVREGAQFAVVEGDVEAADGESRIRVAIASADSGKRGRTGKKNGVDYGRATNLAGAFTAVVFEPGHLSLVKGSPEGRRKFIDAALCQLYPGYLNVLRRYQRAMTQKNALLKQFERTPDARALLDVFDASMAEAGEEMMRRRAAYLAQLAPKAETMYDEISSGREALHITYEATCEAGKLLDALHEARRRDIAAGFCTAGPHREDMGMTIDGRDAKSFASQGQKRSTVLSLKLAEAAVACDVLGEHPVMLLDDVLSELDDSRQAYLLTRIEDKQTFVTTCDSAAFARTNGKLVFVQGGKTSETPFDGTAVPAAMAARGTETGETAQAEQNNEGA